MAGNFDLSEPARNDLKEIWLYIAENNPASADRTLQELKKKFQLLAENPQLGKSQDQLIVRLRTFPHKKYVIFYFPKKNGIEIYRVLHGARDFEDLLENYFEGLEP